MIICSWKRLLLQLQLLHADKNANLHVCHRMDLIDARRFQVRLDKVCGSVAARERKHAASRDIIFPHSAFLWGNPCFNWSGSWAMCCIANPRVLTNRDRPDAAAAIQLEAAIVLSRMIMICLFWQYKPLISCDSEEVITLKSYQWAVHCR